MELAVSSYRFCAPDRASRCTHSEAKLIMNDEPEVSERRGAAIAACRQALRDAQRRFEARQAELEALQKQADVCREVARTGK